MGYPKRVSTLTAIMTTPGFDTQGLSGPNEVFKIAMKESFVLNLLEKEEEALFVIERALTGSRFPFNENSFKEKAKKRIDQGINTSNAQTAAVGASPNRFNRLKEIAMPTLIIHGRHDPMIQLKNAYKMHKLMPHSQLEIIDNMRHLIEPEILSQFEEVLLGHLRKAN